MRFEAPDDGGQSGFKVPPQLREIATSRDIANTLSENRPIEYRRRRRAIADRFVQAPEHAAQQHRPDILELIGQVYYAAGDDRAIIKQLRRGIARVALNADDARARTQCGLYGSDELVDAAQHRAMRIRLGQHAGSLPGWAVVLRQLLLINHLGSRRRFALNP